MGLTFAALLITQQGSIFCGLMFRTAGQISDITGADLWVMDANVRYIDDVKPMIENNLYRVRGVEGVRVGGPALQGERPRQARTRSAPTASRARGDRAGDLARAGRLVAGRCTAAGADHRRRADRPAQARRGHRRLHPAAQAVPGRGLDTDGRAWPVRDGSAGAEPPSGAGHGAARRCRRSAFYSGSSAASWR